MSKKTLFLLGLSFVLALVAVYTILNCLTPMVIDDCSYAATGRSLAAIWERESHDYMTWSGRFVAHSVAQFWGGIAGKSVFNFFNPLVMGLLVCLLGGGVISRKNIRPATLALAVLLIWFFSPDQYVTQFMIAGSMNYLWASALVLLFVVLFDKTEERESNKSGWIGVALFSCLAGAWSEMYAVCVIPAGAFYLWLNRKVHPVDRRKVLMMVCYCIGAAFVVLAPGNFARMGGLSDSTPMGTKLVNAIVFVVKSPLPWLWLAVVLLWLLQRKRLEHFWRDNSFWWLAALGSIAFGVFSGASWPRTHFPTYIFTFVMMVKLVASLELRPWFDYVMIALALIAVGIDFASEYQTMKTQKMAVEYVKDHAVEGSTVTWNGTKQSRKSISNNCFSCNSNNWRNVAFAQYYGLPRFAVVPQEVMNQIHDFSAPCECYSVIPLPDGHGEIEALRIIYYDGIIYKYPLKLARLVAALGYPLNERFYTSKEEAPFNGWLLKSQEGLDAFCTRPGDNDSFDGFGMVATADGAFVYYPSSMNRSGGLEAIRTEFVFQER